MLLAVRVKTPQDQQNLFEKLDELGRQPVGSLYFDFIEQLLPCAGVSRVAHGPVTDICRTPRRVEIYGPEVFKGSVTVGLDPKDFANGSSYTMRVDSKSIPDLQILLCAEQESKGAGGSA